MRIWAKRALGVAALGTAISVGASLRNWLTPYQNPPAAIEGWKLAVPGQCGKVLPADARNWRGIAAARRVCRAQYAGTPPVRLTLFDMPDYPGASPFDAWQKWPPNQPGKIGFYAGRFFGVAESEVAGPAALDRFAVALARALTGGEPAGRW